MSQYAKDTNVSSDRSRAEIEKNLSRYGATAFMYGWQEESAMIAFEMKGKSIKFILPMPDKDLPEFQRTPARNTKRSQTQAYAMWEQACRQRWRALNLCIKAKLEAVECGITSFEHEFLAHFQTRDGLTVGDVIIPQLAKNVRPQLQLHSKPNV